MPDDPAPVDHNAPTMAAPTELGAVVETGPQLAYSIETEVLDYSEPVSRVRVGLVAGGIIAAAAIAVGAVLAIGNARHETTAPIPMVDRSTPLASPLPPAPAVTTVIIQAPPTTITQQVKPSQVPVGTPVAADPDFVAAMQAQGWIVSNTAVMTLRAHQVCGALQQGATKSAVIQHLLSDAGQAPWSDDDITKANQFVSTAMRIYPGCP